MQPWSGWNERDSCWLGGLSPQTAFHPVVARI
jgi:hypothetical protein